jgi:hypothetical protein
MKTIKSALLLCVMATMLFLSGCEGDYVAGAYVPGIYSGPYYGGWGPYGGADFVVGGNRYHDHYGGHHFYGRGFGVHHFAGGSHGFHGGGFHGGHR